jgi:hypothetical protein
MAHQAVNDWLFNQAAVSLPLPFGTVFRSEQSLRDRLSEQQSTYATQIERLRGRAEWVLGLQRDEAQTMERLIPTSEAVGALRDEIARANPGRAFLLKKQQGALERQELQRLDSEIVAAALAALEQHASEVYRETVPEGLNAGSIARFSALCAREREHELAATVERLREEWEHSRYDVSRTGPWPPYRFAGLTLSGNGTVQ